MHNRQTLTYFTIGALILGGTMSSTAARSATLFSDGFESGRLDASQNGISWTSSESTAVSSDRAFSGTRSLKFTFEAGGLGDDAFAEQRVRLPQRGEYWFKYRLYIPTNYTHRSDEPSNNKFLAVYRSPYTDPGFQVNFSMEPSGNGGSNLDVRSYNNGSEGRSRALSSNFISTADRGTWIEVIAQVKVPTSSTSADGVMKIWKNGTQMGNITNLASWGGSGENYISEAYLLGWANSGFSQETLMYIDDVVIADSAFDAPVTPNPPTAVTVR